MPLDYPLTLPCPQTELLTPFERAQYSDPDRPRDARALSLDRLAIMRATWPPLSTAEAAEFQDFWRTDLLDGGAWFNATWPLPQGKVPAVFRFIQQPRWRFVPGGYWEIDALLEQRGRTLPVVPGVTTPESPEIAWYEPVTTNFEATLARANNGTGQCSDSALSPVTTLYAGLVGWSGEALSWAIASWTSVGGDASPYIADAADGWVQIQWDNADASGSPVFDASIGTLVLTCTINGNPLSVGERLVAVTTPPTEDYPTIAWGPEP